MAEVAVESLLENLKQLLIYHPRLIGGAKNQFEKLDIDLRLFKAFLNDSTKRRRQDDSLRELLREIRDVVYQAEDIIDAFLMQKALQSKLIFSRSLLKGDPRTFSQNLESISNNLRDIYENKIRIESPNLGTAGDEEEQAISIREDNLVGFEDETNTLIGYLTEETQQLDIISVTGVPGIGKTTLARKIFHDQSIKDEFLTRIWVHISQEFTKKDVFLDILRELSCLTDDMSGQTDEVLAQMVAANLERKKFLIVMDDLRSVHDWDKIQIALPKSNKKGKVLITCCSEEVGWYASKSRPPHKLRLLNEDESWLLLESEIFNKSKCPPELKTLGKLIAEQCDGLPLAIVVIGSILAREYSPSLDVEARKDAWREAYKSVRTYLHQRFYEDLPNQLRECFLYLGMFPEDYEISAWRLISLWIAEGFIPQNEGCSLEETAESYLAELINRNLVEIDRVKADGKVRTCRIDPMLREFCKTEAGHEKEDLLQEINKSSDGLFEPPLSDMHKFRRLCIHSNVSEFLSKKPRGPHVRSFLCFSKDNINVPPQYTPEAFDLLKVIDASSIQFDQIPRRLFRLIHLKYIALSINDLTILPRALSDLWNIQTIIVYTKSSVLEIKADIWKMMQLRCLKTNASTILRRTSKPSELEAGKELQTLGTISPESCTKEVFEMACNLKKLGIRGQLALFLDGNTGSGSFDSLENLSKLEKLKLVNDVFDIPPPEGQSCGLPPAYKFPPRLKYLTLSGTFLDWHHMSVLCNLECLEVLKLKDKAFMGPSWLVADHGRFHNLEVLYIGSTDLVSWEASGYHFPKLRRLLLRNCEQLKEVPIGLSDVPTLQLLDLNYAKLAVPSAKNISEVIHKNLEQKNIKYSAFKLSIFPPDE